MRFNNKNYQLPAPLEDDRLRFEALLDNSTVKISKKNSYAELLKYSLDDGKTWIDLTTSDIITLNNGDKMFIIGKCSNGGFGDYTQFAMTGTIAAKGKLSYFYNYENPNDTIVPGIRCALNLFKNCTSLVEAPIINATILKEGCFMSLFEGCTLINKIVSYIEDNTQTWCTRNWLNFASATGDFYNLGGATYTSDTSGIPSGWTEHTSL